MKRSGCLSVSLMLAALVAGCAAAPKPAPLIPPPSAQELAGMPLQFDIQLQVIELKEEVPPSETLFPAPGFRLQEGALRPTTEPGTLAGLELTQAEFDQWAQTLKAARAELYMAPYFTVWPGRTAGSKDSTELPYLANWRFRERMGVQQRQTLHPGSEVSLQPSLIEGRQEVLLNMTISWQLARLAEFTVVAPKISGKKQIAPLLAVQIPEERAQSVSASSPMHSGHVMVLAHFVRQSAAAETGRLREHFFYIASVRRIGKEPEPVAAPAPLPDRYALSLCWLEWGRASEGAPAAPETLDAANVAAQSAAQVDAWSCGLVCTPQAPGRWQWSESAGCVTGIQSDDEKTRQFSLASLSAGGRAELTLRSSELAPSAQLTGGLWGPPAWSSITRTLDSLRAEGQEEYHFRAGYQFTAPVEQRMTPGNDWVRLASPWAPRLAALTQPPPEPFHFAAASLRPMPLKPAEAATPVSGR